MPTSRFDKPNFDIHIDKEDEEEEEEVILTQSSLPSTTKAQKMSTVRPSAIQYTTNRIPKLTSPSRPGSAAGSSGSPRASGYTSQRGTPDILHGHRSKQATCEDEEKENTDTAHDGYHSPVHKTQQTWQATTTSDVSGLTPMSSLVSTNTELEELIRAAALGILARAGNEQADTQQDDSSMADGSYLSTLESDMTHSTPYEEASHASGMSYNHDVQDIERSGHENVQAANYLDGANDKPVTDAEADSNARDYSQGSADEIGTTIIHDEPHESDDNYNAASSSDDVFSSDKESKRCSVNSLSSDAHSASSIVRTKFGLENVVETTQSESVSRLPSTTSQAYSPLPDALTLSSPEYKGSREPSKVLDRPPFRTPSHLRALQMQSPVPSFFSTRRSGTHRSASGRSTQRTPSRWRTKEDPPLVLLHVKILPSTFKHATFFESTNTEEWSQDLLDIRESWRLITECIPRMVYSRGVLIKHPQDDFEVLEERLLQAMDLPFRPRAKILECGHYMGSESIANDDMSESDDDDMSNGYRQCDTCGREVKYEEDVSVSRMKRFRCKVYASIGLMGAGAWSAVYRDMEKVDVEIEPIVAPHVLLEMDELKVLSTQHQPTKSQISELPCVNVTTVTEAVESTGEVCPYKVFHEPANEVLVAAITDSEISLHTNREHLSIGEQIHDSCRASIGSSSLKDISRRPHHNKTQNDLDRFQATHTSSPPKATIEAPPSAIMPTAADIAEHETLENLLSAAASLVAARTRVALKDKKNISIIILSIMVFLLTLRCISPQEHVTSLPFTTQQDPVPSGCQMMHAPLSDAHLYAMVHMDFNKESDTNDVEQDSVSAILKDETSDKPAERLESISEHATREAKRCVETEPEFRGALSITPITEAFKMSYDPIENSGDDSDYLADEDGSGYQIHKTTSSCSDHILAIDAPSIEANSSSSNNSDSSLVQSQQQVETLPKGPAATIEEGTISEDVLVDESDTPTDTRDGELTTAAPSSQRR